MTLTAVFTGAPEGGFVAFNPETSTTTQGETIDEALANLKEATELYLEEFPASLPIAAPAWVTSFEVSSAAAAAN
jgi:predicted RNase H-like HicB family nuclease